MSEQTAPNMIDMQNRKIEYRIDVGTEIICPECHKVMVRCISKPEVGAQNKWGNDFESVEFDPTKGPECICPHDGKAWFYPLVGMHTKEHGWTW